MVGGVPFFSPSSRARSAGWTVCAAVHGSGGRFSCPRMAGTATRAPDAANRIATAETKKQLGDGLSPAPKNYSRDARFLDEWICGFKEIAAYFLRSARVRWSFMAVVRRVSGTFLLEVRRLRSTALSMGSM